MLLVTLAKKEILMVQFYLSAALSKHIGISPPPSNGGPIWLRKYHYQEFVVLSNLYRSLSKGHGVIR